MMKRKNTRKHLLTAMATISLFANSAAAQGLDLVGLNSRVQTQGRLLIAVVVTVAIIVLTIRGILAGLAAAREGGRPWEAIKGWAIGCFIVGAAGIVVDRIIAFATTL